MDFLCFATFSTKKWGKSYEHSAKSKDSGNMTQKWKNKWKKNDKKMINKWKKLEVFCIFGIQLIWFFLAPIFHFGFHFFIIFFHSQIIFHFSSFVFRILINHCPFFIISIHFSSFSLLFPWISCVLQHFSTKKWGKSYEHSEKSKDSGNMTHKWSNKWKKNDKKMINKWKKLEVFCIFGISTHLAFLGSNFSFWFSFFYHFFFIPKLLFIFFSFVFRILINHCPFFIISIHFSSFSLLFPWISCVLQHFSTKKWGKSYEHSAKSKDSGNMTQKWKNKWKKNDKKMIKKWKINENQNEKKMKK